MNICVQINIHKCVPLRLAQELASMVQFSVELPVAKWSLQLFFFRGFRFHFIGILVIFSLVFYKQNHLSRRFKLYFFSTKDRVWAISLIWESEENYWATFSFVMIISKLRLCSFCFAFFINFIKLYAVLTLSVCEIYASVNFSLIDWQLDNHLQPISFK